MATMDRFPVDFRVEDVMKRKADERNRLLREKIEEQKKELREQIYLSVMKVEDLASFDEKRWWWQVKAPRRCEKATIEEIREELETFGWVFGKLEEKNICILCSRRPSESEIEMFKSL